MTAPTKIRTAGRGLVSRHPVLLVLLAVLTGPVLVVAWLVVRLLRRRPDRAVAWSVAAAAGALCIGAAWLWGSFLGWWAQVAVSIAARQVPPAGAVLGCTAVAAAVGPLAGALYWRWAQRQWEADPAVGVEWRRARERREHARRRVVQARVQERAHAGGDGVGARVAARAAVGVGTDEGPYLGRYQGGDLGPEFLRGRRVILPVRPVGAGRLRAIRTAAGPHFTVLGGTGTGKSEIVYRVAEWAIEHDVAGRGGQVVWINCKEGRADQATALRLTALAEQYGVSSRALIAGASVYDPIRGSDDEVRQRLVGIERFGDDYYEHVANLAIGLALDLMRRTGQPVQTLPDLVARMNRQTLGGMVAAGGDQAADAQEVLDALSIQAFSGAMLRYASYALRLREWIGSPAGGGFSFEDAAVTAWDLPAARFPQTARGLLRMLLADATAYLTDDGRRPAAAGGRPGPLWLFLEELSATDGDPVIMKSVYGLLERARSANAHVVLVAHDPTSLGGDRSADAILSNSTLVTTRQITGAETVARLGGTTVRTTGGQTFDADGAGKGATAAREDVFRLHPNELRQAVLGDAWVIHGGRVGKVAAALPRSAYGLTAGPRLDAVKEQLARVATAPDGGMAVKQRRADSRAVGPEPSWPPAGLAAVEPGEDFPAEEDGGIL